MTAQTQNDQALDTKTVDKELNFRKQEQMFQRQLDQERQARQQAEERAAMAEKAANERSRSSPLNEDDDDDSEPYVDKRKLNKSLAKFEEKTEQKTAAQIQRAVHEALDQERRSNYLKENSDFNQIMAADNVQKFADRHPRLAENILRMPEGFERQKLVYENIKALGLDKAERREPSVQEKIDANRKSPYYQPSSAGAAPYSSQSDYSPQGQKSAYDKMQELKSRLRI